MALKINQELICHIEKLLELDENNNPATGMVDRLRDMKQLLNMEHAVYVQGTGNDLIAFSITNAIKLVEERFGNPTKKTMKV